MRSRRAISPVIGVVLMIVMTLLLASVVVVGVTSYGSDLDADSAVPTAVPGDSAVTETVETVASNRWFGSPGDLFQLSNDEAGATNVSMRVNFSVEADSNTIGNSLNSVYMEVTTESPAMFSGTERTDLEGIGVDEDGDGEVDRWITGDVNGWTVEEAGSALKVELSGSAYSPEEGDSIVLTFGGVTNPADPGSYELRAQTSGDGNWHYGTISITT